MQHHHEWRQSETTRRRGEVITRLQGSNTNSCDWRIIIALGLSMRILGNYFVHDLSSLILDSVRIADISTSRGLIPDKQVGGRGGAGDRGAAFENCIEVIAWRGRKRRKNSNSAHFVCTKKNYHKTLETASFSLQNNEREFGSNLEFWILSSSWSLMEAIPMCH